MEGEPLPEGTRVTVHLAEEREWDLDEASTQELLLAATGAELEEGVSSEQILAELRVMK